MFYKNQQHGNMHELNQLCHWRIKLVCKWFNDTKLKISLIVVLKLYNYQWYFYWRLHTFKIKKTQTIAYASGLTTSHNTLNEKSASYTDSSTCVVIARSFPRWWFRGDWATKFQIINKHWLSQCSANII